MSTGSVWLGRKPNEHGKEPSILWKIQSLEQLIGCWPRCFVDKTARSIVQYYKFYSLGWVAGTS